MIAIDRFVKDLKARITYEEMELSKTIVKIETMKEELNTIEMMMYDDELKLLKEDAIAKNN